MNSTFGTWLIGAGVAALVLLLLLGGGTEREVALEADTSTEPAVAETETTASSTYWRPVTVGATAPKIATPTSSYVAPSVGTKPLVGGCRTPSTPCRTASCGTCSYRTTPITTCVPMTEAPSAELVGSCGYPDVPCSEPPCTPFVSRCYDVCADPCRVLKPGINRNMPLCVDECSFIQLHSTVSHPTCGQVCFEWSASKGWFLDPTSSDPLYFAPTTQFCNGEDVWITLIVTDASGAQYSDVVSILVRDLP